MNMLVERGPVPFSPANDEDIGTAEQTLKKAHQTKAFEAIGTVDPLTGEIEEDEFADFEAYEALRKEAAAIHVLDWQVRQLEIASKLGLGPPRVL